MGGRASRDAGTKGEREVGRLMLQEGYLAWRTSQNRQSKLDTESDDVAVGMVPEHMRRAEDGSEKRDGQYLDLYHIDRTQYPDEHTHVRAIDDFEVIPNLNIEVKNGYNGVKTYNKQFTEWLDKLRDETPTGYMWALFWRMKYSGRYEYRVCYEHNGIIAITISEEHTRLAIGHIAEIARKRAVTLKQTRQPLHV